MTLACELRDVYKSFGRRTALGGISLQVEQGEMVAITGESGSGKTTVLNLLGVLEAPDSGEVLLFGDRAPKPLSRAANLCLRHRLGYLFQNFALIDNSSVRENLQIALTYSSKLSSKSSQISDALERVGLRGAEGEKIYSLSGGEQQRVAIARLLLKPCDLILADEPTGALDASNGAMVLNLLQEMNAAGKTIVVASHDVAVVAACSRSIELPPPTGREIPEPDYARA